MHAPRSLGIQTDLIFTLFEGDLPRWRREHRSHFGDRGYVTLTWDDPTGAHGEVEPFRLAGFELLERQVMTAASVQGPTTRSRSCGNS